MHLELAGPPRATLADGTSVSLAPRDAALLAWLSLEGPTSRARLANLLWPESGPEAARNTLRQRLFQLKKHCGGLLAGATTLRLADGVRHDLDDAAGVLGELRFGDAPELDRWLDAQRERRTGAAQHRLEQQVRALEDAGELAAALPVAQALLRLQPLSEQAHRHVMRLHYLRGDRAAALLAFDRCEQTLKDEVGTRPSAETLALLQTVERALPHTWIAGQALPASALRPPTMVGRDSELAALAASWAAAEGFVVTGQAGSGKSRLLDTLAEARPGTLVLRARPGDDKVPLATLDRLVHRLCERSPELGAAPARARFRAQMAGPGEDQSPTAQSVAPILVELLRAARRHGLTGLVLDDLQFADDASFDVWQELLAWPALADLGFGFASRLDGERTAARLAELAGRSNLSVLALHSLDGAAVRAFVESLGLAGVDSGAVAAALVRRIGGNPLHLLETIRHALEKHGHLHADRLEAPARVTELLEQRLVALPADGLLLVRIAAVAGGDFDAELAAAVSRRDVLELADAWHALERQGLLDSRGFMHDLIGEAAERLLPRPIARVLHGRVAAWLAPRNASAARLAHHLLCSGDEAAAVPFLAAAARQAWHLGRSRESRDAYLRAAAIEAGRGRTAAAFDLLFECSEAIATLGPREAFDDVAERMAVNACDPARQARLAFMRANNLYQHGDHEGFLARMDEVLALAIAAGDRFVEAECQYAKGNDALQSGRLREAIRHMQPAAALLRGDGREQRAIVIEGSARTALLWTGQARSMLADDRAAAPRILEAGSSNMRVSLLLRRTHAELLLGDGDVASLSAGRAIEALRGTDMIGADLASATRSIAEVMRRRGHWSEALAAVAEAEQRLPDQGDPDRWLAQTLAEIYLDLGRPDLAHRHIESFAGASGHPARLRQRTVALRWAYSLATGAPIDAAKAIADAVASEHLLQACKLMLVGGQGGPSQTSAGACADLIGRCAPEGLREQLTPLHSLHAWLLALEGQAAAARCAVQQAQQTMLQGDTGAMTPLGRLWLARACRSLDRPADAAQHALKAVAWLKERVQRHVPAEFRDSFLHRHPVNRELLAWNIDGSGASAVGR